MDGSKSFKPKVTGTPKVSEFPQRLLVDLRTDCNLKCPMCIVHGGTDDPRLQAFLRRTVDIDKAKNLLDEVMEAKPMLQPNMWTEPLLAPNFKEFVSHAKQNGIAVALNTNGLLLKEEMAEFLVREEIDSVSISIDATTSETLKKVRGIKNLDKIHRGVQTMIDARGDRELPRIGVSFTLQDSNISEEKEFIDYWIDRVDVVRIGELFVDGYFPAMRAEGPRQPCPAIYSTMAVQVDGNVSICCLDGFGETNMGNVFEDGVMGVWHGEKLTEAREYHETGQWDKVPFCKNCERWASYVYEEEVEDDILIRRSVEYTYYNRMDRLENWTDGLRDTSDLVRSGVVPTDE